MVQKPLPEELPGGHTERQIATDYVNALGEVHARAEEAEQLERQLAQEVKATIDQVKHKSRLRLFTLFSHAVRALKEKLQTLIDYRQHLEEVFLKHKNGEELSAEDLEIIHNLEKRHPCRRQLRMVTNRLRSFGHAKEEEMDLRRISLLKRMAMMLARHHEKPDRLLRKSVIELVSNKKWRALLEQEKQVLPCRV